MKQKKIYLTIFFIIISLTNASNPAYAQITNPVLNISGGYQDVLATIFANIWKAFVVFGSIGFVLYFLWGAFRWMTAEGDKAKFESGREKITNAATGLILIVASVAIIQLLGTLLDIEFLRDLQFDFPTP